MPPPSSPAELLVKVLLITVAVPPLLEMPPPAPPSMAPLLVKVLPLTVTVPKLKMPPPASGGVAGEGAAAHRQRPAKFVEDAAAAESASAELLVKVLPLTVSVPPSLKMPPPASPAELLVKVLPITVSVPPAR